LFFEEEEKTISFLVLFSVPDYWADGYDEGTYLLRTKIFNTTNSCWSDT
jgi:hypothetical protein